MDFSSNPAYLDASNWHQQQQQNRQIIGGSSSRNNNPLLQVQSLGHPGPPPRHGSVKPESMVDRARLANIPMPEAQLKCPRCDSTNTKFCYYNNYSLSQPRHFCKTCRRYWTKGGALRNVPVGGGCRKNKRSSKSRNPKSSDRQTPNNASSAATASFTNPRLTASSSMLGVGGGQLPPPPLRFMSQITGGFTGDMEGSFITPTTPYRGGGAASSLLGEIEIPSILSSGGGNIEQWRLQQQQVQQFPFMGGGLDTSSRGIYTFQEGETSSLMGGTAITSAKEVENHNPQLNLSSQTIAGSEEWGGTSTVWNELSHLGGNPIYNRHV